MITENIGTKLVTLIGSTISTFLGEAATETYPYAVYDQVVTPHYTKDGIYKYTSDLTIHLYGKDFDTLDTKCGLVITAIETGMTGAYSSRLLAKSKDCVEDVWDIQLTYIITQNS